MTNLRILFEKKRDFVRPSKAAPSCNVPHNRLTLDKAKALDIEEGELVFGQHAAIPVRRKLPEPRQGNLVKLDVCQHHPPGQLGESPNRQNR